MSTGRRRGAASAEVEVMISAARVFAGITAESLAQAGAGISLPQLRVLVLASRSDSLNATEVAAALQVHLSTSSRLCDWLSSTRSPRTGAECSPVSSAVLIPPTAQPSRSRSDSSWRPPMSTIPTAAWCHDVSDSRVAS